MSVHAATMTVGEDEKEGEHPRAELQVFLTTMLYCFVFPACLATLTLHGLSCQVRALVVRRRSRLANEARPSGAQHRGTSENAKPSCATCFWTLLPCKVIRRFEGGRLGWLRKLR